ncbi:GSCFA domain-containing protein [Stagnihabitans tardus]|uniref:GSCFA domain-containing protein n=1 Tax=Stagnihabitans tardus TaxID=2699202 RepID=UPI003F494432
MKKAGYNVLDLEPLPKALQGKVSAEVAQAQGYGLYSARYGNVYTIRQLLQLFQEALGQFTPAHPVWEKDGRFYDALRPGIELRGFASPEEVMLHRAWHLKAVAEMMQQTDIMVFTFGLTEAWVSRGAEGTVYPTAPGTIAGRFDPELFEFKNFAYPEIVADFIQVRQILRGFNPRLRFIVTVSPVPLTATASGEHVEVATVYSKSVLRAACGAISARFKAVDYFPSYEVITSQSARGAYYEPNLRSVNSRGVETAMGLFMAAHDKTGAEKLRAKRVKAQAEPVESLEEEDGLICEEALLEAFNT